MYGLEPKFLLLCDALRCRERIAVSSDLQKYQISQRK